jgi:hypothetical protein
MSKIIDRNFLINDIRYYDGADLQLKTIDNFKDAIVFWKMILHEGYGLRAGDKLIVLDVTIRFNYCCLVIAAAELGIILLLAPEKSKDGTGRSEKMDEVVKQFGKFELCLLDDLCEAMPERVAMTRLYGKQWANMNVFYEYEIKDHALYETMKNTVTATPDSTLFITTTSGTTGTPKILTYDHEQMHNLAKRNGQVYEYPGERVCHTRNMHHAFVLMAHFLPTLTVCKEHYGYVFTPDYGYNGTESADFYEYLNQHKISKLVLSYKVMLDLLLEHMIENNLRFEHTIDMITGGFYLTKDYVEKLRKTNVRSLYSTFGSNETASPVLLRRIWQTTDNVNYDENYLGTPPDDFYSIHLEGNLLHVRSEGWLGSEEIIMSDDLSGNNETGYWHHGRSDFYRINDVEFKVADIKDILDRCIKSPHDIVIDMPHQKIYVALWKDDPVDLHQVNQELTESLQIKIADIELLDINQYNDEFKLNHETLRTYFRSKEKL